MDWIAEIRQAIRDFPELNTLLEGQHEFSDREIESALRRAVDRINLVSPITSWTLETVPRQLKEPLLLYTISHLLQARVRELSRNNIDYQSGGTGVTVNQIIAEYAQAASVYEEKAELLASRLKIQFNVESGFGEIFSPYDVMGWW